MLCNRRTNVLRYMYLPPDEWRRCLPDPLMRSRGWWTPLSLSLSLSFSITHTHIPSLSPSLLASLTFHTCTLHTQTHLIIPYTPMYSVLPPLPPCQSGKYLGRYQYSYYMMILYSIDFTPHSHITSRGDISPYLVPPTLLLSSSSSSGWVYKVRW